MTPSGQIEKRLEIIRIAISMTDEETISLQRLKLRRHRDNKTLDSILAVLDDGNYAQATSLIERYINVPKEEEKKNTPPPRSLKDIEEEKLIKKFGLFIDKGRQSSAYDLHGDEELTSVLDLPSIERVENSPFAKEIFQNNKSADTAADDPQFQEPSNQEITVDEISVEEFIPKESNTIDKFQEPINILSDIPNDAIKSVAKNPTTEDILAQYESLMTDHIPKKVTTPISSTEIQTTDFEIKEYKIKTLDDDPSFKNISLEESDEADYIDDESQEPDESTQPKESKEDIETLKKTQHIEEEEEDSVVVVIDEPEPYTEIEYEPISYIDQKVKNMLSRYPQIEASNEKFDSEETILFKISLDGYTESDIVQCIDRVFALIQEDKLAEASHLLIIAASTESIYAQFILARELYRGRVLQQNIPEAFTQINQLAQEDYPEAVCDLAQFYEHGIGTNKNKKKAFRLYEDALDLGIERADMHLTKLEEESRGFLGKFFRRVR